MPVFDAAQSGDVTAILGKTAILNCRVGGLGNRRVAWIRLADKHILTVGRHTITRDPRFSLKVLSEDYLLQILPVQVRGERCQMMMMMIMMLMMMLMMMMILVMKAGDSGVYECQVSTTPVMSHHVILNVAGKM